MVRFKARSLWGRVIKPKYFKPEQKLLSSPIWQGGLPVCYLQSVAEDSEATYTVCNFLYG